MDISPFKKLYFQLSQEIFRCIPLKFSLFGGGGDIVKTLGFKTGHLNSLNLKQKSRKLELKVATIQAPEMQMGKKKQV